MESTGLALAYGAVPLGSALAGGLIAALKPTSAPVRSAVQHVAAGVVFAAAALELLPPLHAAPLYVTAAGFCAGILLMYLLRIWTDRAERSERGGAASGLFAASAADTAIDGIILGAAFASGGAHRGALIAVALATEMLFVSLSVASSVRGGGWKPVLAALALGLVLLCGDVIGVFAFRGAPAPLIEAIFAFGAVVFMYLVTEELLTHAHRAGARPWLPPLFFGGFLGYFVLQAVFRG